MEPTGKHRRSSKRSMGLAVWLLILAAFVALAVYSGVHVDPPSRF